MSKEKKKIDKCRYAKRNIPDWKTVNCIKDKSNIYPVCEEVCENCESFKSKYIEYPITVEEIKNEPIDITPIFNEMGSLCRVKPLGEEYGEKTYMGFLVGELPLAIMSSFNEQTGVLTNRTINNPAIFVPELKKIIYGNESYWEAIESEDDMRDITDSEIENVWYVQLLKSMFQEKEENKNGNQQ